MKYEVVMVLAYFSLLTFAFLLFTYHAQLVN